jgi:hypothetical protein
MSALKTYLRERPGKIDYGTFLYVSWVYDAGQVESLIETWRRRSAECTDANARAEWLARIDELRAFLAYA